MLRKGEPEGHLLLRKRPILPKIPRTCEKRQGVSKAFVKVPLWLRCASHFILQKQLRAFQFRDTILVCADHCRAFSLDDPVKQLLHLALDFSEFLLNRLARLIGIHRLLVPVISECSSGQIDQLFRRSDGTK
ncbi:MAG: hypothetical protein ACKO01_14175 [Erythrobacter sp.]